MAACRLTHEGRAEAGAAVDGVGPRDPEAVARQAGEVVQDVGRQERLAVEGGGRRRGQRGEDSAASSMAVDMDGGRALEADHGRQRLQLHRRFGETAVRSAFARSASVYVFQELVLTFVDGFSDRLPSQR